MVYLNGEKLNFEVFMEKYGTMSIVREERLPVQIDLEEEAYRYVYDRVKKYNLPETVHSMEIKIFETQNRSIVIFIKKREVDDVVDINYYIDKIREIYYKSPSMEVLKYNLIFEEFIDDPLVKAYVHEGGN